MLVSDVVVSHTTFGSIFSIPPRLPGAHSCATDVLCSGRPPRPTSAIDSVFALSVATERPHCYHVLVFHPWLASRHGHAIPRRRACPTPVARWLLHLVLATAPTACCRIWPTPKPHTTWRCPFLATHRSRPTWAIAGPYGAPHTTTTNSAHQQHQAQRRGPRGPPY